MTTLVALALAAAAMLIAGVAANPAQSFPSRAQACTNCHNAAPSSATVSATPSTANPAAGAAYSVAINLSGLSASGDTGYWISSAAGTPAASVYGGDSGTNQTTYTQTMTAPTTAGTYTYTVWCDRGGTGSGVAKSTTYSITVAAAPAPTAAIASLSPNHGLAASNVVIAGANLGAGGTVRFGTTVAATTAWSATSVTARVPALASAATTVTVTQTGGAVSNGLAFTVDAPAVPAAAIASLSPTHALTGTSVVIAGANLGAGGTVRFGTTLATTTAWSASQVTATVPALTSGATTVTVTPTGGAVSNGLAFTVDAPPVFTAAIASLSPTHALTGTSVVIAGVNLGAGGTVRFGTTLATTTAWSASQVTATVPALTSGATTVTVTPTGGAVSNGLAFTVDARPSGTDTTAPTTRALNSSKVKRYKTATLRYQVNDAAPNGGTATVVVTIKNRRGQVVKVLNLGTKAVNTQLSARFKCTLRTGTYRFYVQATDAAGNAQANIASQTLTVTNGSSDHHDDDDD